ncbi:hypothetical protein [uncultured Ruegeria sp.]|uniref:hypothetical protein n=1 Tax=uncultured Ruegeria sp. TaxID=259304 RepID=UPI002614ACA5|nr:hypothetical protein [uncultured Ruegeria sp.]
MNTKDADKPVFRCGCANGSYMRRVAEIDAIGTKITGGGVGISVGGVDAADYVGKGVCFICACFDAHNDDDGSDLIEDTVHRTRERAFAVSRPAASFRGPASISTTSTP